MISPEEKEIIKLFKITMRKLERDYRIAQTVLRGEFLKERFKLKHKELEEKDE